MLPVNTPASVKRKTIAAASNQRKKLRSTQSVGFVVENISSKISPTTFTSEKKAGKSKKAVGSRKSALKKTSVKDSEDKGIESQINH